MRIKFLAIAAISALTLAGCGDTPLQQGLFGAGAGVTGAAVLGGDLGTGAAVGAIGNLAYCQTYPERC